MSDIIWRSEVAKGKLHSILRLEVSQLSKSRVSDFLFSRDMTPVFTDVYIPGINHSRLGSTLFASWV